MSHQDKRDAGTLSVTAEPSRANATIAFTAEQFGRRPSFEASRIVVNELADAANVLIEAVKFTLLDVFDRSAIPRAHRVNEHKIGKVQQREGIAFELIRRTQR
jgi:hypothetical protein